MDGLRGIDYSGMLLERNSSGDRALADGFIASGLEDARALNDVRATERFGAPATIISTRERPMAINPSASARSPEELRSSNIPL